MKTLIKTTLLSMLLIAGYTNTAFSAEDGAAGADPATKVPGVGQNTALPENCGAVVGTDVDLSTMTTTSPGTPSPAVRTQDAAIPNP